MVCLSRASSIEVTAHTPKEKISVALFSPCEMLRLKKRAACSLCGIGQQYFARRHYARVHHALCLRPAIGDAGCDRLQSGRIAMPAAVVGLLKRKRLLDPDAISH